MNLYLPPPPSSSQIRNHQTHKPLKYWVPSKTYHVCIVTSQKKMRFREYLEYFAMGWKYEKINHSEGSKNINLTY